MSFNKNISRKILAAATALTMVFAGTACGESTSWVAKCQDEKVNSGIFIYYQTQAMSEATSRLVKDNSELDTSDTKLMKTLSIDGKDVTQWVNEKATKQVKEYAAVNEKFDELGLELSADDISKIKSMSESFWGYYSGMYEQNGIGEDSFRKIVEYDYKKEKVFLHYYGEGGEKECDDAQIAAYLEGNYSRVKYIKFDLTDSEGNALDNDAKAEVKKLAEEYKKKADSGKNFDDLIKEYDDYKAKKAEEAAAETAEVTGEAAAAEAVTGTEAETTGDVTSAEESAVTTAVSEDEAAVTETSDETAEGSEGEVTSAETSEEETSSETTEAASEDEDAAVTSAVTDENGEPAVTEEASEEKTEEAEETDPYQNEYVLKKGSEEDGYNPSEAVNKAAFNDCVVGGPAVIVEDTENNGLYLVQRLDVVEREDYFEGEKRTSTLMEMFKDEFSNMASEWADSYGVTFNDASLKRYDPFKIKY
ncbi:hypothetical protein [Ruminococcus sp. HUN007]|uniref:hypothetical protein n=1 Tax=Ruminococcus sp. HUN007 TaxID=1514668 RepID=UPI0005D1E939|nr:hypothetical protein [Ruminococcus sp. HUN007]